VLVSRLLSAGSLEEEPGSIAGYLVTSGFESVKQGVVALKGRLVFFFFLLVEWRFVDRSPTAARVFLRSAHHRLVQDPRSRSHPSVRKGPRQSIVRLGYCPSIGEDVRVIGDGRCGG